MSDMKTSFQHRWFLWLGLATVLSAAAFWQPLKRATLAYVLLHTEAPTEEVMASLLEQSPGSKVLLERFWSNERIPHRQFVVGYLGGIASTKPDLVRQFEPLLLTATRDVDLEVRQRAFSALAKEMRMRVRVFMCSPFCKAE